MPKTPDKKIPFLKPAITDKDIALMLESINTTWLVSGEYTETLESDLTKYFAAKDAAVLSSATAALHLSLILAGVGEGDEVITTPISWVATSNVILYQQATPVFVDVDLNTGLIDVDQIEAKITKKTKAILIVHLNGLMVDMKKLKAIADKYNIPVIEDAAHALEAKRDGIRPGELGLTACLSFHAAKNITSGQGGACVVNDKKLGERLKLLRRDGVLNRDGKRVMYELGYKYDLTDFQAAMLIGQLARVKETHEKRMEVYRYYMDLLKDSNMRYITPPSNVVHAAHMFMVFVNPDKRDMVRDVMYDAGIETSIHYPPIHLEPYYVKRFGYKPGSFPAAEQYGASAITLPTYSGLATREQEYIVETLKGALK